MRSERKFPAVAVIVLSDVLHIQIGSIVILERSIDIVIPGDILAIMLVNMWRYRLLYCISLEFGCG